MRAELVKPARIQNPAFNNQARRDARKAGRPYTVKPFITAKPGFILNGPDCWAHCCPGQLNAEPIAKPLDDECRDRVTEFLETTQPLLLQQLKAQLESLDSIDDKDAKAHLTRLGQAYGLLPGGPLKTAETPGDDPDEDETRDEDTAGDVEPDDDTD